MARLELVSRDLRRMALAGGGVEYVLVRRRGRRGVGLKVDEGGLTVSAPASLPLARIEAAVRESERWVLAKLDEWSRRRVPRALWAEGAPLPYLGEDLVLRLRPEAPRGVRLSGGELTVGGAAAFAEASVRRAVVAWYREEARAHLGALVARLAARAGLAAPRLFISGAMARWGSCNSRREVRLAWRLLKAPPRLVEYVVCHELAHLVHMDHSPAFWAEVERQCPDYRALRRELLATDHLYRSF